MNGPEFFQTRLGAQFFDGTLPKLVKIASRIAAALEEQNTLMRQVPSYPKDDICDEANCNNCGNCEVILTKKGYEASLWADNEIQFARLLCEIRANCEMEGFDKVHESMDLDDEDMDALWRRADSVWEKSKETHCPTNKILSHLDHLDQLEVACYGSTTPGKVESVTVECTKCGEVVDELYNRDPE